MIRSAKIRSMIARLGLVAILLVAIAPTVSQLLVPTSAHDAPDTVAAQALSNFGHEHGASTDDATTAHAGAPCLHDHGGAPDCSKKCGYCDLLSHSPSVANFHYFAALAASDQENRAPLFTTPRPHDVFLLAAQPRGPPRPQ